MAIAICSAILVSTALGILIYQGTKDTVTIMLDGKKEVVRTHAATVNDMLEDLEITVKAADYVHPSRATKVDDDLEVVWKPAQKIVMVQDGKTKDVWSTADTVDELLKDQNLSVKEQDKITPSKNTKLKANMEVAIDKAFSLKLVVGGDEKQVWSTSTTVADFLKQQGVKLNDLDRVEPELTEKVEAENTVNVVRIEKVTDVVEEPVDFAVITKKDDSLSKGKEKIVKEGKDGLISKKYKVIKENGKEVKRELLSEKVVNKKQDKVVTVGTRTTVAQASRGVTNVSSSSGKEIYVSSTAYTASCKGCSGVTSTGVNLKSNPGAKIIAVDPNVIPLGSKVYVDGYGYAVAADKGGAIKGNRIDVFFSSKNDAYRWGVKRVKIRVLD
ncbi:MULTISPECIES: G5 and 3D domain-containing protein [Peribacillus]|uniref:Cell wall-binding protein YocH n=1 Tax=Peribacillus simplex TaxID=1478 RepID=A0A9W4KWD6_9BACI|nr:G5 and 3D domain-containing protein [Peribacillus simplex]MDR4928783.1 ubiquitin-like domain-containing protein [Peribacillus simplex]WHX91420.1 ubiquitin-like domain-containing protein [Peribacillus simplex]CAH0213851.1 Cell wall-binding protein YocH [Peribacillus simplex]